MFYCPLDYYAASLFSQKKKKIHYKINLVCLFWAFVFLWSPTGGDIKTCLVYCFPSLKLKWLPDYKCPPVVPFPYVLLHSQICFKFIWRTLSSLEIFFSPQYVFFQVFDSFLFIYMCIHTFFFSLTSFFFLKLWRITTKFCIQGKILHHIFHKLLSVSGSFWM